MNRRILALAIPNIVTNIAIPLLGMVDMGLMGHLESGAYVGAIAIGTTVFSFIYWSFGFLRMGTSGFTAQALGSRNLKEAMMTLYRSLAAGLGTGLLLILLQWPIDRVAHSLINGSPGVETLAREYFYIRIYSAPPTLCLYAFTGWFIGMQNARIPMILSITVNALNILFSLAFIQLLGMKADGIALANVISQFSGLFLAVVFFLRYYRRLLKYPFRWNDILRRKDPSSRVGGFIRVNGDIFIRTLCLILALSFFTARSAAYGDTLLAVNSLLFQLFYLFSYFIDGFAYAAEALVGKAIGARDTAQLRAVIRRLFVWGLGLSLPFTLLYATGSGLILGWMTDHDEILAAASPYLFWVGLVPLVSFAAFLWDGIYVGATASAAMRSAMLTVTFVLFLPAYYLLDPLMGNHGLWLAFLVFLAGRGIILSLMARKSVFGKIPAARGMAKVPVR